MAKLDRVDDRLFLYFLRARLDHHNAFGGAHDHDVEQALAHLVVGGIDDELSVDQAHAYGTDRTEEGNVGNVERGRRRVDAAHVRIIFTIRREDKRNNLRLVTESFGEHGTNRAIDLPAGENFFLTHAAFALDEAAWKASAGVGVLTIVNGEREKIDSFARLGVGHGSGENNVVPKAHDGRSVGLLGDLPCFKCESFTPGQGNCNCSWFWFH